MRFATYADIEKYLDGLGLFHMDLTLGRVRKFAAAFGAPGFIVVHVAGTNGKGSTSAIIERLARNHGLCTGLYASPHFLDLRERLLVDGAWLGESQWVEAANEVDALAGDAGLTYFEFLTCLAMCAFRRAGVEFAVMEAGLGGRYDAVRAFGADLAALTPIGLDHMQVLGPTLEYIARDKAHVIRDNGLAFSAPQEARVAAVLAERAEAVAARLAFTRPATLEVGMRGAHQRVNAGLALAVWESVAALLGIPTDHEACREALLRAFVPGRFQRVKELGAAWVLDGAHNEPALMVLAETLRSERLEPAALVAACMRDKDLERMAPLLRGLTAGPVYCPELPQYARMLPGAELAALLGSGAEAVPDCCAAFERAAKSAKSAKSGGPVLVCGSLYLLAEFYRFYPRHLLRDADQGETNSRETNSREMNSRETN